MGGKRVSKVPNSGPKVQILNDEWWVDRGLDGYMLVLNGDNNPKKLRVQNKKHKRISKFTRKEQKGEVGRPSCICVSICYFYFLLYLCDD